VCGAASHLDRKLLAGTNELLKTHQHAAKLRPNTMPPTFGRRKARKINRAAKPPQKLILLPNAGGAAEAMLERKGAPRGGRCAHRALFVACGGGEGGATFQLWSRRISPRQKPDSGF